MNLTDVHLRFRDDLWEWPLALTLFFSTNSVLNYTLPHALVVILINGSFILPIIVAALRRRLTLSGRYSMVSLLAWLFFATTVTLATLANAPESIGFAFYKISIQFSLSILFFAIHERGGGRTFSIFFKFESIVIVAASVSLFFWLFGEVLGVIPPIGTVNNQWSGTVHNWFFLHFSAQGSRNCGAFVEAPMFNLVLCTALITELFLRPSANKRRIAILVITILTSRSTTGQMLLIMLVMLKVIQGNKNRSILTKMLMIAGGSIIAIGCITAGTLVMQEKSGGESFAVRARFMIEELEAFANSPILGHGLSTFIEGTSNSICLILAEGGLFLASAYIAGLLVMPKKLSVLSGAKKFKMFGWCYFFLFSITVSPYNPLTFMVAGLHLSWFVAPREQFYEDILSTRPSILRN